MVRIWFCTASTNSLIGRVDGPYMVLYSFNQLTHRKSWWSWYGSVQPQPTATSRGSVLLPSSSQNGLHPATDHECIQQQTLIVSSNRPGMCSERNHENILQQNMNVSSKKALMYPARYHECIQQETLNVNSKRPWMYLQEIMNIHYVAREHKYCMSTNCNYLDVFSQKSCLMH